MSKITSLVRRAPKRFSALVAIVAAAIIVPAAVFAWGPDTRKTYTMENPAQEVTFNSITNNKDVGDERNFVRIREDGTTAKFGDNATLEPGKVYEVSVYYHNNAATRLNESGVGIAHDAKLRMELPGVVKPGVNAVLAGNISASNANPKTVWDEAYGKNATNADIALRYVEKSAKFTSNGKVNGQTLPDSLFTTGANLGFNDQDGNLPGCNEFAGYVTFKFRVDQPNFTVKKEVSTDGKTWKDDTVDAKPGATVQYRITYQNTGTSQQDNVSIRDILPAGVTYVPGSSLIANSVTGGKYEKTIDGVTTTGYNAGSYQPKGNAYFKFSATLPNEAALKCGINTLNNTARITTTGGYKEDTAEVKIPKECKPTVAYTCESLKVTRVNNERTKFRFTTTTSEQGATFKSVTYIIRNANGTEVERIKDAPKTVEYTQATVGNYTVQAVVSFTVNGETKTAGENPNCKQPFEVPAQPEYCPIPGKEHLPKNSPDCVETPVPPVTPPTTPPELPHTGIGDNIVAFLGLGSLIASIGYYVASRRALS
jgi:uncharacterized repeat protein (TIGR01451 family)/LPXTG-motif cell wall-anchored protein